MIDARQRNTAFLVAGCFFMENLDSTIVTTAAPNIGESFGVPPTAVGLVMTAYLVTFSVLIPLSAWLTSRLGVRPVFLAAIVIFTLASLGCAASGSLPVLVAMRVLQGVGAAMMVPVGRMAVLSRTDKPDLLRMMAYIVWPGLLAPVVAPLAGALITTYASWQWLFLINVPLGVFASVAAWKLVGEADSGTAQRPLDWLGLVLTCGGLGGLTFTAHLISDSDTGWPVTTTLTALCLAGLGVAGWHLLRTPNPLVALHTLRVPTFRLSQSSGFLFWIVVGAAPFLCPLMWQNVFGYNAITSGTMVLFIFVGNLAIKPATTPMLNHFGFRPVLLAATITLALSMIGLGFTTASTPLPVLAALALLSGVARSVGLTAYATIGLSDVPPEQMRDANTLAATTQQLSTGLAIALATVALRLGAPLGEMVFGARSGAAYTVAFTLLGLTALIATAGALRLHPQAGNAVRTQASATSTRQPS
ncbi:MFS transporter [Saccharopolyspora pogona]|uniref:MFS transporter n=1 Tax=Saccharopolyspora pogona TaxID=333966 RepID=UPI0016846115|nr:MFS transporter [Saccharopolyspora pogona]